MLPRTLYHASSFRVSELKPGFQVTGKLVRWDRWETNKSLYAVDNEEDVILLGFGSAIEKSYLIDRYQVRGDDIIIHMSKGEKIPCMEDIFKLNLYVYTIKTGPEQLWVKNNNKHNLLENEWKTKQAIPSRSFTMKKVDIRQFLKGKNLRFEKAE